MRPRRHGCLLALCLGVVCQSVYGWTTVGPGIEYQEFNLPDPNNVFVTRLDRKNSACLVESSIAQGRLTGGTETVSSQAARYDDAIGYWNQDWGRRNDVVAAINGDFWNTTTGVPASGQFHSGWFAKEYNTSGFGWTLERNAFIATGVYTKQQVRYPASGVTQVCDGVNRERGSNELVLYTPQYDSDTNTDASGVEVLVEMTRPAMVLSSSDPAWGFVKQIRENLGSTPIPFDHVVLSATGTKATTLLGNVSIGAEVAVSQQSANVGIWTRAYAGVGAGEIFLMNGVVVGGQMVRHPRTAIALNSRYVFFVVVDGRSGVSVGMDMIELGNFCQDYLGATWGINQDGGGSSTLVVNGTVMNDPSDGRERSVANGMLMVALQPKVQSTTFNVNDEIKTTATSNVRLGPGTNYAVLTSVGKNTQGTVLDHHLRGVFAKGYYWWKCDFGGTAGWVAESLLTLVSAGGYPTITQHPVDQEVCDGTSALFSVSASGTGSVGYQWQRNGINLINDGHYSGVTTSSFTVSDVGTDDVASYRCVVTDDVGSTTSYSAALLSPKPLTVITRQPMSQDTPPVPHGSDVSFTVIATGAIPLTYQWQKDENDLFDDGHYVGAATSSLTIMNVNSLDDGSYRCRVSADCGTVYSDPATLKVITADFDGDGDVDQEDFGHLQACFSGLSVPQDDPDCLDTRLDGDSDTDQEDFLHFQNCLGGPHEPFDPACLD